MHPDKISKILQELSSNRISVADAEKSLKYLAYDDIGFARVDHHRHLRSGMPEVIYAPGKTDQQIIAIAKKIKQVGSDVLISRVEAKTAAKLKKSMTRVKYYNEARMIYIPAGRRSGPQIDKDAKVVICSAGTSDIPVAEEAAVTAWAAGCQVDKLYDVGVAGLHRLTAGAKILQEALAIVVVAGMEGALASVVGGLVDRPVIAVPTSVGYGASFGGVAALLGMLNSCSTGVVVVNIDNGFGAGMAASMIAQVNRNSDSSNTSSDSQ